MSAPFIPLHHRGQAEWKLRQRFAAEWQGLTPDQRKPYRVRACNECGLNAAEPKSDFVMGLIDVYAWTLFAEASDPVEAKAIAMSGWTTQANVNPYAAADF